VTSVTGGAPRRVGLFGGTFDPPHIARLVVAVDVRHRLGLDEVLLVPNGDPWQKRSTRPITPARTRLALVEAAVAGIPGVGVSAVEVDRPGASYTIDTVEAMLADEPGLDLVLVVGSDAAHGLTTWERHRDLLALVTVAVVDRPGASAGIPTIEGARLVPVEVPALEVSSTDLRHRVAAGAPIDALTPPAVVDLVRDRGLYR